MRSVGLGHFSAAGKDLSANELVLQWPSLPLNNNLDESLFSALFPISLQNTSNDTRSATKSSFPERECLKLADELILPHAIVTIAQFISRRSTIDLQGNHPTCDKDSQVINVDICRLALNVTTSLISSIVL